MGLKTVVSTLLPREYREQVLGDLEERGFRPADIAQVLPRIWWSHMARLWTLPRYALAEASDATLELRARQFQRAIWWRAAFWLVVLLGEFVFLASWGPQQVAIMLVLALLLTVTLVMLARGFDPPRSPAWRRLHHQQLDRERWLAAFGIQYMLIAFTILPTEMFFLRPTPWPQQLVYVVAVAAVSLVAGRFRARRLQREIRGLQ